jgi:hypothetical protein
MSPDRNNLFGPEDRRMFRNWSIFAIKALGVLLWAGSRCSRPSAVFRVSGDENGGSILRQQRTVMSREAAMLLKQAMAKSWVVTVLEAARVRVSWITSE